MTDKLRTTQPLNLTFVDGEGPTSAKLSAIANQSRVGARILEKAIGDIWNQSGDPILSDWPLQISNLGRLVGESHYLNPVFYPVYDSFEYIDSVGAKNLYANEAYLQFGGASVSSITAVGGSPHLTNKVASKDLIVAPGDWYVDSKGKLYSFSALTSQDKVQYTVDPTDLATTNKTLANVIPDPRQTTFTGCRISESGGNYFIHLPPRQPLTLTSFVPDRYPPAQDIADNLATTVSPKKLWQTTSGNALADRHYRYALPKEIDDVLGSLGVGAALPEGFLYLWDNSKASIVDGVGFLTTANPWVFQLVTTLSFAPYVSANESESSYSASPFSIVTLGSPISRVIDSLMTVAYSGKHDNAGDFTPLISHSALKNLNPPDYRDTNHNNWYPSTAPAWTPSNWFGDDHTQYLSRLGSFGDLTVSGNNLNRDVNDNAMLGDFVLASTVASGNNFLNNHYDSHKIFFGQRDEDIAPYIIGRNLVNKTISVSNADFSVGEIPQNDHFQLVVAHGEGFGWSGTQYFVFEFLDAYGNKFLSEIIELTFDGFAPYLRWSTRLPYGMVSGRLYKSLTQDFTGAEYRDFAYGVAYEESSFSEGTGTPSGSSFSINRTTIFKDDPVAVRTDSIKFVTQTGHQNEFTFLMGEDPGDDYDEPHLILKDRNDQVFIRFAQYGYPDIKAEQPVLISNTADDTFLLTLTPQLTSPNYAPLLIHTQDTDPTVKTAGSLYVHTGGHLAIADGTAFRPLVKQLYAFAGATSPVTATSGETVFPTNGVCTIPANIIRVGSTLRVRFSVSCASTFSSDTLTVRLRYNGVNGTLLFATNSVDVSDGDDVIFDGWFMFTGVGATGSGRGAGMIYIGPASNTASTGTMKALHTAGLGPLADLRTDQSRDLVVTAQWSSSNAGNSCSLNTFVVDL